MSDPRLGSRPAPSPDPLIGRLVSDRFRVLSLIAKGGMGRVYRAEQIPLGRTVALKVLHVSYEGIRDDEFRKRFFLEAAACAKLSHPNTVTIFDYGQTDDDVFWIAMELLEGRTLRRAIHEGRPFTPERTVRIARQIARSLRDAHRAGLIHRDLKSANVFLVRREDDADTVKVLDFGLVKVLDAGSEEITKTGLFMGSPKYMSPEQVRGDVLDARTDVYSLGVIMYEMLTGKVPFEGPTSTSIMMAHMHDAVPTLSERNPSVSVPEGLERIVMRCLSKTREDRFESMAALTDALNDWAADNSVSVIQSEPPEAPGPDAIAAPAVAAGVVVPPAPQVPRDVESVPPPDSQSVLDRAARKSRGGALALAALLVLGAGGVGGVLLVVRPWDDGSGARVPTRSTPSPTAPRPITVRQATVPVPPDAPRPSRIVVQLVSTPVGAMVEIAGRTYGPTPTNIEWAGDDPIVGTEGSFRFRRTGHRDVIVMRRVDPVNFSVTARLEPIGRTGPRPRGPDDTEAPPPNPYTR